MKLAPFPLAACAALLATPAAAQINTAMPQAPAAPQAPAPAGFTLHRDAESCWFGNEPDASGASIATGRNMDGASWLRASGAGWAFTPGEVYALRVEAAPSNPAAATPAADTIVAEGYRDASGRPGFIVRGALGLSFWSPSLAFYRKDEAEPFATLDNPFSGSRPALGECMTELAKNDLGSGAPAQIGPAPRGDPRNWVTNDDYPAAALRAEQQGRVEVRLTVSAHGMPSDCVVTASSGSALLDMTACRLFLRRARFRPAQDAEGKATQGSYSNALNWMIPSDEPEPPPPPPIPSH